MILNLIDLINWDYEITFIVWDNTIIFGEFGGDCYKQKYMLN